MFEDNEIGEDMDKNTNNNSGNNPEREKSTSKIRESKEELRELREERDELLDKYLRSLANYENLRKRVQKEKDYIYNLGIEKVFKEIFPVVDDLERALDSLEKHKLENNKDQFIQGIRIIYSKLKNILKNYNIEPFHSKGEIFDPKKHDAVSVVNSKEQEGTVLEEVERGYLKNDKIIRPAKVIVAKETEGKESKDYNDKLNKKEKNNKNQGGLE